MVFICRLAYLGCVSVTRKRTVLLLGSLLAVGSQALSWNALANNPYSLIKERNAFGLKDPPPPAPPPEQPPPPAPPAAKVTLTGITTLLGKKKAFLEILEPGGREAKKPILMEGETLDGIEVISIDVDKNEVVIKNAGARTNLTFAPLETAKSAAPAPPPGTPGVPIPPPSRLPGVAPPNPTGASTYSPTPTLINPNPNAPTSGRGAIVLSGGGATATPTATPGAAAPGVTTLGGATTPGYGTTPGTALGVPSATGLRQIPTRQLRTDASAQGTTGRPMTREEAYIQIEAQRLMNKGKNLPPLPPTPLTPLIEGDQ
jgi:hypothetical protein